MDENSSSVVTVARDFDVPAQAVWDVLADGWLYANWVVGASRIRDVEVGWPAEGSRIHHSVGLWPGLIDDNTEVLRSVEPHELALRARGWPIGEAEVVLTIEPTGESSCRVTMTEDAVSGPGRMMPRPARQLMIGPRNVEALLRLALLAEGRYRDPRV